MKMPTPDAAIVARRREIATHLRTLLSPESVIEQEDERRVYESDGLTAYRQPPLIAVLPASTAEVSADRSGSTCCSSTTRSRRGSIMTSAVAA